MRFQKTPPPVPFFWCTTLYVRLHYIVGVYQESPTVEPRIQAFLEPLGKGRPLYSGFRA